MNRKMHIFRCFILFLCIITMISYFTIKAFHSHMTSLSSHNPMLKRVYGTYMSANYDTTSVPNEVEVYSRVGCKYCRMAKYQLDQWKVPYINIDINHSDYPTDSIHAKLESRYKERILLAKTTTVPQIFVGKDRVGGCDNLLSEMNSKVFFERLKEFNISLLSSSPLKDDSSNTNSNTSRIEQQAKQEYIVVSEYTIGEPLNKVIIQPIHSEKNPLPISSLNILELSGRIQLVALQMIDKFSTPDGKLVNYSLLKQSNSFLEYLYLCQQLCQIPMIQIEHLSPDKKLSLFVNIYNAMIIHANIVIGSPANNPIARSEFFSGKTGAIYEISLEGLLFSPDDIEHGLIRCNRPHPSSTKISYFDSSDIRVKYSIPDNYFDPRIHFILNCGARSCPPIQIMGENPKDVLQLAAAAYLSDEIRFDWSLGLLYLPRLSLWYAMDFGKTTGEQVHTLLNMLPVEKKNQMIEIITRYCSTEEIRQRSVDKTWIEANTIPIHKKVVNVSKTSSGIDFTSASNLLIAIEYNSYDWTSNENT